MGTEILIYREININNEWYCIEPMYATITDNNVILTLKSFDCDKNYQLFGLLSNERYMTLINPIDKYPKGLPDNLSKSLQKYLTSINKPNISYLTYQEIDNYLNKWKKDIIDTGTIQKDFFSEESCEKIQRFDNGLYKNDYKKRLQFYSQIWESENILLKFRKSLDNLTNYTHIGWMNTTIKDFKNYPTDKKRIIFYYS